MGAHGLPSPPLLLITDRSQANRPLIDIVAAALDAGCRWISVREKDLSEAGQIAVVTSLRPLTQRHGARLTLHGSAALAQRAGADGVHLSAGADAAAARRLLGAQALIGLSVHRPDELSRLRDHVDYVVLGPAYATTSKPGYGPALSAAGIAGFLRENRNIFSCCDFYRTKPLLKSSPEQQLPPVEGPGPVRLIAIGGITSLNLAPLMSAGAAGIAVMGGVMRADDPGGEVRALLAAMTAA